MIRLTTPFLQLLGMGNLTDVAMSENAAENPLWHVICNDSKLSAETDGLLSAMRGNPAWPRTLHNRLLDTVDLSAPASALGELRAYGMLACAGFRIRPIHPSGKAIPTPDFAIQIDRSDEVFLEVATKRLSGPMERRLKLQQIELMAAARRKAQEDLGAGKNISIVADAIDIWPFECETAKPGDSPLTDAISKIAAIKSRLRQLNGQAAGIFWLDMMDPVSWRLPIAAGEFKQHYRTGYGGLQSGSVWNAFFGKKGDELVEYGFHRQTFKLAHDGKFVQAPWLSAAIITTKKLTVLYENPKAQTPLPSAFRLQLEALPNFDSKLSKTSIP